MLAAEQSALLSTSAVRPPAPPRIVMARRLAIWFLRLWPFAAWCGAVVAVVWLYFREPLHSHALAHECAQELRISPAIAGRIASLEVAIGQWVDAGDLVATLEAGDVEARLRLAQSELERSLTRIDAEREALRLAQVDRQSQALARRNSYESEGRRLRGIADTHVSAQATDQAELDMLTPQIERLTPLLEKQLTTADRIEELVQRRTVLEQRIASRTGEMRRSREELSAWEALAPDAPASPDLGASLLPFEIALKSQEARVAELELEREKCRISAPTAGTVSLLLARPGEWRAEGEEIARVVLPSVGRVDAYIGDRQVSAVAIGTRATLSPRDRAGPPLQGTVEVVGPLIEEIPLRLRAVATIPQWGRRVTIAVEGLRDSLAGTIYDVRFH